MKGIIEIIGTLEKLSHSEKVFERVGLSIIEPQNNDFDGIIEKWELSVNDFKPVSHNRRIRV